MGLLLSILFSYVGAVELMFIVRDIVHQVGLHHEQMKLKRTSSKTASPSSSSFSLQDLQQDIRKSIKSAQERLCETDAVQSMVDGVQYEQGYRILQPDEDAVSKRWLQARASLTTEPPPTLSANNLESNGIKTTVNDDQNDDTLKNSGSFHSNSLSAETNVEQRKIENQVDSDNPNNVNQVIGNVDANNNNSINNNNNNNNDDEIDIDYGDDDDYEDEDDIDDDEVPNIHFDEYSQDCLHTLDGIPKKNQRKNDESRRRKSYKMFTGGHSSGDVLQRRRSEDIDGETDNPWGELKPESFHDHSLWKRERAMSIAENEEMMAFVDEKSYQESFKGEAKPLNSLTSIDNDDLTSTENKTETQGSVGARTSDVSSENQFISSDSFGEIAPSGDETIRKMQKLPEIFVDVSDIDEVVGSEKTDEFHDYIDHMDDVEDDDDDDGDGATAHNKFEFKDYLEQPSRLRYPSYNDEGNKDNENEIKDFSIVQNIEHEPKDLANENKLNSFESKRAINNRKPNMFALATSMQSDDGENKSQYMYRPVIRVTSTEDERVEQFLYENGEQCDDAKQHSAGEYLVKSKTMQMFDYSDENGSDIDSFESDSRANSPSLEDTGRDSLVSDIGSDPIQFECKRSADRDNFDNRDDSSASNKSNVLFERSQSRFSELEYIKGREDWKDSYIRYDISEEIDSDNYHHLRRHSEAADALEFIRGREDWLRNELRHAPRNSLPRIFEMCESKIVIEDEINSDEYHHNFIQSETFSEDCATFEQRSESLNDDAKIANFTEHLLIKSNINEANKSIDADNKSTEWTNDVEIAPGEEAPIITWEYPIHDDGNEITENFQHLVHSEASNSEDLELAGLDVSAETVIDHQNAMNNPFIVISEAPDDNEEQEPTKEQKSHTPSPEPIQTGTFLRETNTDETLSDFMLTENTITEFTEFTESTELTETTTIQNVTNTFIQLEIQSEMKSLEANEMDLMHKLDPMPRNNRNVRAKSESLLKPNEQKPRRTLSFENVEDLIRDVSLGPWFHN